MHNRVIVDHTPHDTSSIMRTIEDRFGLGTLNAANSTDPDATHVDARESTLFNTLTTLSISRGSLTPRVSGIYRQKVTVTNIGRKAVTGPIYLVLENLSQGTTLTNATGITKTTSPKGSPYVVASVGKLAPGASATAKLKFNPPTLGGLAYQVRTVTGVDNP